MARQKKTNNRRLSAATQESRAEEETTQRRQSDEESGFPARCRRNAAPINDRNIVANCDDVVVIRDVFVVVVVVEVVVVVARSRRRGGIGRGSRSRRARRWSARPLKQRRQKSSQLATILRSLMGAAFLLHRAGNPDSSSLCCAVFALSPLPLDFFALQRSNAGCVRFLPARHGGACALFRHQLRPSASV